MSVVHISNHRLYNTVWRSLLQPKSLRFSRVKNLLFRSCRSFKRVTAGADHSRCSCQSSQKERCERIALYIKSDKSDSLPSLFNKKKTKKRKERFALIKRAIHFFVKKMSDSHGKPKSEFPTLRFSRR